MRTGILLVDGKAPELISVEFQADLPVIGKCRYCNGPIRGSRIRWTADDLLLVNPSCEDETWKNYRL